MTPKTVLLLNLGETTRDPRVRRVAGSLAAAGHKVLALNPMDESTEARTALPGYEVVRFPGPSSTSQDALRRLDAASEEAGAIVRAADAALYDERLRIDEKIRYRIHRRASRLLQRAEKRLGRPLPPLNELIARLALVHNRELARLRTTVLINLQMAEAAAALRPDVVCANDLNTLLAGFIVKRMLGIPLVYDAHEIFPEQYPSAERSETWHDFYTRLEEQLVLKTDARMTVCDSLARYFEQRYRSGPFVTVRNLPSRRFLPEEKILRRRNQPRVLLYHGGYFKNRGLEALIRASKLLRSAVVVLRGFGGHEPELRKLAEAVGSDRLTFSTPVPVDELVTAASTADVGLNPFPSACLNTEYALPNKFFEYLMAGLAVASSNLIELASYTRELDVGILFRSLDPAEIAEDLESYLRDPEGVDEARRRAWEAARDRLHWELEQERLLGLYARVA